MLFGVIPSSQGASVSAEQNMSGIPAAQKGKPSTGIFTDGFIKKRFTVLWFGQIIIINFFTFV